MNKWILTLGLVASGYVLFQFNSGELVSNDVFRAMEIQPVAVERGVESVEPEPELPGEFSVMAFGDMMVGRYVRTLMDRNGGPDYVFENLPEDFFEGSDVVFGNLEGPIYGQGRSGGTSMVFAFNEDIAPWLKRRGFDLVSISNNHSLDAGWEGYARTIETLEEAEVGWCGHPAEETKAGVFYGAMGAEGLEGWTWGDVEGVDFDDYGVSFAFVCLQDVTRRIDDEAAVELIEELDEEVDFVIVSVHWGNEYYHRPHSAKQVEPARAYVDAGADFIIGHHPHVVQSFEVYNDRPIFYSLGNFVFDQYWSKATQEELGLKINFSKEEIEIILLPMKSERSQSRLMRDAERLPWIEEFIGYGEHEDVMKGQIRNGKIKINLVD